MSDPSIDRRSSSAGFTLMELSIAVVVLVMITAALSTAFVSNTRAFSGLAVRSHLSTRAQTVMDRLHEELLTGHFVTLTPPVPDTSDRVRFRRVTGFAGGAPVYGNPVQIEFVPEAVGAAGTNGLDDNGNGLIDDGSILVWEDLPPESPTTPGAEDRQAIIATSVAANGLSFTRMGKMLLIDLTLQAIPERGSTAVRFSLSSGIQMRND